MMDTQAESNFHSYKEMQGTLYLADRSYGNKTRTKSKK